MKQSLTTKLAALAMAGMLALPLGMSLNKAVAAPKMAGKATVKVKKANPAGTMAKPKMKNGEINKRGGAKVAAPASKGGPRTKDAYFTLHVDNRSQWITRVYVDGNFRGTVGPYGDLYVTVASGNTVVYCEAPFDDGSTKTWNDSFFKSYGEYTLRLYD